MSKDLERNKILAALLVAGITAMFAGFIAKKLVHPHELTESVLDIDVSALESASSGGSTAPAGPEPILALLETADIARGQGLSKTCLACHTFEQGGANKIGPNLYNIVNAPKAHIKEFAYSATINDMAAKGEKWSYQNLNAFLWKPNTYAKGTKMVFPGFRKPQDRADAIAYLRSLSAAPAALPSADDIAAEAPPEAAPPEASTEALSAEAAPEASAQE